MSYIRLPLKNILNINRVVTMFAYDFGPKYSFRDNPHDFWEVVYVDDGEVGLEGNGVLHRVSAGEMIFHKPNEEHAVYGDGIHSSSVFIITFECHSPAMKFFYDKVLPLPADLRVLMKTLIEECNNSFYVSSIPLKRKENQPVGSLQLIHNYLECILICMMRNSEGKTASQFFRSRESLENNLVRDLNRYLKAHIYDKVSLEELSREFHFGISTLCNIYKKSTGSTIMHTFLQYKIDEAKRLLNTDKNSISEIADLLGFDTPQYFSRMFHRYAGQSPRKYRSSLISAEVSRMQLISHVKTPKK